MIVFLFPSSAPSTGTDLLTGAIALLVSAGLTIDAIRGVWTRGHLGPSGEYPSNWYLTIITIAGALAAFIFGILRLLRAFGVN